MTRAEIACALICSELRGPSTPVRLSSPWAKTWTTFPPPAWYQMIENALLTADFLLTPKEEKKE